MAAGKMWGMRQLGPIPRGFVCLYILSLFPIQRATLDRQTSHQNAQSTTTTSLTQWGHTLWCLAVPAAETRAPCHGAREKQRLQDKREPQGHGCGEGNTSSNVFDRMQASVERHYLSISRG